MSAAIQSTLWYIPQAASPPEKASLRSKSMVRIVRTYGWCVCSSTSKFIHVYSTYVHTSCEQMRTYCTVQVEVRNHHGWSAPRLWGSSVLVPTFCYSSMAWVILVPNDQHDFWNIIDVWYSLPKYQSTLIVMVIGTVLFWFQRFATAQWLEL